MVNLTDKMRIVQTRLSGKSNRGIAAELGLDRKTVDKYVSRYEAAPSRARMRPSEAPNAPRFPSP